MTPDDLLERLLDAVEQNNYWDTEAYAQAVLDNLSKVNPKFQDELKDYLNNLIHSAREEYNKQKAKDDLINQIMKPK
jgi:membrane-bound lytic murein transglycosylase MltF